MAILAEVIGKKYYSRLNGDVREVPVGTKIVVKGIPEHLSGKLKKLKEVDDGELIVNDDPEAARLRAEGKPQAADKLMDEKKEKTPRGGRGKSAQMPKPDDK